MGVAVEVRELTHYYQTFAAVDRISFQIAHGTIFGLLGPNGAGKSTTIKMLTTLLPVSSGSATVCGYDLVHEPGMVRQNIGYVSQMLSADGDLTGYENLLLSAKLYGLGKAARLERIAHVLEFMGLAPFANLRVNQYSGGMIRRLEIGQALVADPKVLFLDEPSVGLDPAARKQLWKIIQDLRHRLGTTLLVTTHDMEEADHLCDMVAFMHLGHIVGMDTPANLKAAIGYRASLDDVFIQLTGTSIKEEIPGYDNTKQTRKTFSQLD
jgi:ABC-2 type transport system ATP-binding protein